LLFVSLVGMTAF